MLDISKHFESVYFSLITNVFVYTYVYMYLHKYCKILAKIQKLLFQSTNFGLRLEDHVEREALENFKMCLITPAVGR